MLDRLASALEHNDEQPNIALAPAIQSDAVKVLYEIGALKPALIAPYADVFLDLLSSSQNQLVWGGMTALGCIAGEQPDVIWSRIRSVMDATVNGSVITQDWGVRVLASVGARTAARRGKLLPFFVAFLDLCPHKDMPKHAERALPALDATGKAAVLRVLKRRTPGLTRAQTRRLQRVVRGLEGL